MGSQELIEKLGSAPVKPVELSDKFGIVFMTVGAEEMMRMAKYLKETPELAFDLVEYAYGTDWLTKEQFEVGYYLTSTKHQHDLVLRCFIPRDNPKLHTLSGIWQAANMHEREVFDLLGIEFSGHPYLQRLLTPPGFEGYPLRKDYAHPDFEPLPKK